MSERSEIEKYFDSLAGSWNENYHSKFLFAERLEKLKRFVSDVDLHGKNILDLGCGSGFISLFFCQSEARVSGIDVSENMIRRASEILEANHCRADLTVGDAGQLKFPDETFDIIACISVLEWIEDDETAVREIARVLKPGGFAIISVPNQFSCARKAEKIFFHIRKSLGVDPGYLRHQKHQYDPVAWDRALQRHGLRKTDSVFYVMPLAGNAISRWLARKKLFGMMYFVKVQKSGETARASSHSELQ